MSLIGRAFGRAVGGAGRAMSDLANKYIDEELAANRAKMLEELRHQSAVRMDQYNLSPERQAKLRENATQATVAEGRATRTAELEGLNDTAYQGARTARADADAAAATRRDIKRLEDMTPAEIAAQNQITEGTTQSRIDAENAYITGTAGAKAGAAGLLARAQERARASGDSPSHKLALLEDALGRKLTEDERLAALGLKKGKDDGDPIAKLAQEAAKKALELGDIKPEEAGQYATKITSSFRAIAQEARLDEAIRRARSDGKLDELIAELRQRGATDEQLAGRFTADELRGAAPAAAKPRRRDGAPSGPVDRIGDQPIGLLTPRAWIEEAAKLGNRRAIEYLRGQQENAAAARDSASMINVSP